MTSWQILAADYQHPAHQRAIPALLNAYAQDPMGGGEALATEVQAGLVPALAKRPDALTLLAFAGEEPIGLLNAFEGFSTFACQPLINIHDIYVAPDFRGQGICAALITKLEAIARQRQCCKITLEVLSGNPGAQKSYQRLGFAPYALDPTLGQAEFWEKKLQKNL